MKLSLPIALASGLLLLSVTATGAATVVEFDIANANAGVSSTVNVANADANVAASTMVSTAATLGAPFFSAQSFCYLDWPTGAALDPAKYYEFSVAPGAGYSVLYQTIDLAVASGGSGTGTFEIHASLDGFGSSDIPLVTQNFTINATWQIFDGLDISALGSQAGPVTFRFYMYSMPASGFSGLGVDPTFGTGKNFFVNGVVSEDVVPVRSVTWSGVKALYGE